MKIAPLVLAVCAAFATLPAAAQTNPGVERLYVINCGEGVAGDISRWSPGVNVGKSMDFVDSCYLIKHAQGWMLWDTGLTDAIADMPAGQAPPDPRATHWKRPKKLAAELDKLGVAHTLELFEGTHSGVAWRYPGAIRELVLALALP